ncbi:hypothetical protein ACJA88_009925 [Fusarium oxysporum]
MRFLNAVLATVAISGVTASTWFPGSKPVYNKWHETELERWLSDHDVPYPTPADRKDLESLIEKNWENHVVTPYNSWDTNQLSSYLQSKGKEAKNEAAASKDSLLSQVKANWYETEGNAQSAWLNVKDWILDTWTESQLKAFADKHGIPVPQPRHRDTLLQKARSSYETVAKKANQASSYPGNWLYETWSESDLKEWLDTHGFPAPQPMTRDKLIASVRRNSRLAYLKAQDQAASATASAQGAYATLTDMIIDAWSESQLKEFCDKNGIAVPQGTKANELRALVRKHRADILGDNISASAASAYGAATSNAQNQYAKATDSASLAAQDAFNQAVGTWSDSRLKSYLDARGVPVPQGSKKNELEALVRKNAHQSAFDEWTETDLKAYLDSYGVPVPQGSKLEDLKAEARKQSTYFRYGTSSPTGTFFAKLGETARDTYNWVANQLQLGGQAAKQKAAEAEADAKAKIREEL